MSQKQSPSQLQLQQQQSVTSLIPALDNLLKTVESVSFQQIDPNYTVVIKQPIDLKPIKIKLAAGEYQDPWKFVEDVRLMFDNALMHKRKASVVYRYCSKLAEFFEEKIDPVMQSLGYCCGRKYVFQPQVLCCYGKQFCMIPRDAKYWSYGNRYTYCIKCFSKIPGDTVTLGDDTTQPPTVIKKDQFVEMKNDHLEQEPFVECLDCGRKLHQICVLHFEKIWTEGFTCENCLKAKGEKRKENKFTSKRLQQSKLGQYIENRVNGFLKKKECGAGEVTVRVVSNSEKFVEVKPGMKLRYLGTGELPDKFPYKAKKIFAFEEIDGVDICFFGMHVQEYGSECPMPNTRRVYIAYLDSVHFFRPKQYRTAVYHEILLGYLEYAKQLGYNMAHIWACPPREGEDHIFHCHPTDQKIPTPKRLQEWYKKTLDQGLMDRVVMDYKNQAIEDNLQRACEIPYFEGDVWPNMIEESIKDLDQKEEKNENDKTSATAASNANEEEDSMDEVVKDKKRRKKRNYGKYRRKVPFTGETLLYQLYTKMKKHQDAFFIIRLHSEQAAASLPPVVDKDPVVLCDIMDRENFLKISKAKCYEFSSVRRTKFSTMALLYELHIQGQERFICNNCQIHVERKYHAIICDDFDLCVNCFDKDGQTSAGNANSSNQPSPGSQPNSSPHPPQPGIGIKPSSTGPLVGALQAVQHVQAAAARQTAPHMITPSVNYGKDVAVVSPPAGNESVMTRENAQLQTNCFDKDGHNHKMKKLVFGLNDDSGTCDQKQTNPQESRLLSIQQCIKYLVHASQCSDANCRLPSCQKMKRHVQHAKSCKQKIKGGCPNCKQLIALCCYHAKHCQEANCPTFWCMIIKTKLHYQELQQKLQQKLQEARILKGYIATMQNRGMSGTVLQTTAGNSNCSIEPLSGTQPNSSPHPPEPDISVKPSSTGPPVGALQADQQVQAAAARQTAPHMITPSVNYGKGNPVVSPPAANASVMTTTQQMQAQMQKTMPQMMSGTPNRMVNMSNVTCWDGSGYAQNPPPHQNAQPQTNPQIDLKQASQMMGEPNNMTNSIENSTMGPPLQAMPNPGFSSVGMQRLTVAWQRLHQALKSLPAAQQKQQALEILKSNPQLMAAFRKQRTAKQQQQQQPISSPRIV